MLIVFVNKKVKASTEIGYGNETRPLTVSTSAETPIPHLMIFTANSLWLADLDKHTSLNQSLGRVKALSKIVIRYEECLKSLDKSNTVSAIHYLHNTFSKCAAKKTVPVWFSPVAVAFINHDRKVYWIDTQGDLYSHDLLSDDIKMVS